mmetsp:Transcript_50857/g.111372  ORF Transcript_50857/g.111372 Transcript_50857/m.111372 type:complete len:80 (-) Transcript_50857:72-311(-)
MAMSRKNPGDFLKSVSEKKVLVKLNNGTEYRGILACLDGYLNIALENGEEWETGAMKKQHGDILIRGNNVLYISALKKD